MFYNNVRMDKKIRQLRRVDYFGKSMRLAAEKWGCPWKTLISIMLSARTRDETTMVVAKELFKRFPSLIKLSGAKLGEIEKVIKPINFYKNKSRNILNSAKILVKAYGSNVPMQFGELMKLPGVGRKTANVFLSEYGEDAIGVDTHVFYISKRLGWCKGKTPDKVESELKRIFPKQYWRRLNPILVRFGKTYTSKKEKDILLEKIRNS